VVERELQERLERFGGAISAGVQLGLLERVPADVARRDLALLAVEVAAEHARPPRTVGHELATHGANRVLVSPRPLEELGGALALPQVHEEAGGEAELARAGVEEGGVAGGAALPRGELVDRRGAGGEHLKEAVTGVFEVLLLGEQSGRFVLRLAPAVGLDRLRGASLRFKRTPRLGVAAE